MPHRFTRYSPYFAGSTKIILPLLLVIILSIPTRSPAQPGPGSHSDSGDSLHIGLALSGGGAKGLAHIGVLKVLDEAGIKVDYIAGSSMGSIVGGLYAIGYSPEKLEEITTNIDWNELFNERPSRRYISMHEKMLDGKFILSLPISTEGIHLPEGLIAGQNVYMLLSRLTWPVHDIEDFSNFPIPYACIATELETGDQVLINNGYLPDAMRASMAIPSLFTPYTIDGQTLVDGGLANNLPVQEVRDMGADYVIAVDVMSKLKPADSLNTMTSILNQAVSYQMAKQNRKQRELSDMVIRPDIRKYDINDFQQAQELIDLGEKAAREVLPKLKELARREGGNPSQSDHYVYHPPDINRILIKQISIHGLEQLPADFVRSELGINKGSWISPSDLETAINRVYSTQFFEMVTYRLTPQGQGTHLEIRVIEKKKDVFRIGFRYDTDHQASLLLHTTLRNAIQEGSLLRFNSRLGDLTHLNGTYIYFGGVQPRFGLRGMVDYTREPVTWFDDNDNRVASLVGHDLSFEFTGGSLFSTTMLIGAGIRKEYLYLSQVVNKDQLPFEEQNFHSLHGMLWIDTYNRASFPTRGTMLYATADYAGDPILSPADFTRFSVYWHGILPFSDKFNISPTIYAGHSSGSDLPLPYWFSLGHLHPWYGKLDFVGYKDREIFGRNVQMAGLSMQYEFAYHKFITLTANTGNGFENWNWNINENHYRSGFGLSVGALTILGPAELKFSTSDKHDLLVQFQFGYRF